MILRRSLVCHYCSQKSGRKYDGKIRRWSCHNCEAVNYLDEDGNIADPPATSTPKHVSHKYGSQVWRTTSPDLSPQENSIFCATCLQNQHLYQQMLASYDRDSDWEVENYKKELDIRYPQVCKDCGARVNKRLEATAYAARADNLRRKMAQGRPSPFGINRRTWGWRRLVVVMGGTLWWSSLLGQSIWHVLGLLPPAEEQRELRNSTWHDKGLCATNSLMFREIQYSCLNVTMDLAWLSIWGSLASFWWNPKLSKKLASQESRLRGLESYLLLQILSLTLRAAVLYAFGHPEVLPTGLPKAGIHGGMLAFLLFTTLLSFTTAKLTPPRKPNLKEYHPLDIDSLNDPLGRPQSKAVLMLQNGTAMKFPISSLTQPMRHQAAPNPPSPQLTDANFDHDNEMDWTPTGPSEILHITPQHAPEYRRPEGPNPFRGILPPAPIPPAHKFRNPKPFLPASEAHKNDFMKEIRGEIRAVTGSPADEEEEEDDVFGFGGRRRNGGGLDMMLGQPKMRDMQAEKAETGLEGLFNKAFSIKDQPVEMWREEGGEKKGQQQKGYVLDGETVRENVVVMRGIVAGGALLVALLALTVAVGWIDVKGFVEGVLYKGESVREVHRVVEEIGEIERFG